MEGTTILVTGASGLLGRAVMEELSGQTAATVVGLAYSRAGGPHGLLKVDLTDAAALAALLAERRPDVIVHCAAERQPDVCEHDDARTVALNVSLVEQLAAAAEGSPGSGSASSGSGSGCWMVALSTDYVFDGRAPPFATDAPTRPLNKYGESKAAGERAFRAVHPRGALLRVPVLFGPTADLGESATTVIAKDVRAAGAAGGASKKVDDWGVRYPTFTPDVAVVIRQMIERHVAAAGGGGGGGGGAGPLAGTFHWTANCTAAAGVPYTKYKLALLMGEVMGVPTGHLAPDSEQPGGAPRPRDCHLDRSKLEALGIGQETDLREALAAVLTAAAQ
jgi:dTDP-4-dehydrorhamnose reductase